MDHTEHAHAALPQHGPDSRPSEAYLVVVNEEEQRALWPAALAVPDGWRQKGHAMRKDACLSAITAAWPDIAPASVRDANRAGLRRDAPGPGREIGQPPSRGPDQPAARGRDPRYVHEVFDDQASRQPDSPAVVSARDALTYRQLSRSANRLAHHLQGLGVAPETLVGVCLERGTEMIRCLLAILKAGGAYLPLDPSLPGIRLAQMREEAGIGLVLTDSSNARAFAGSDATLLLVDQMASDLASHPSSAPPVSLRAANIAYAIWTSGSAGRPKAVAVSHGSLRRLCQDALRAYALTPQDRVLQLAAVGFDTSLEQILATLLSGAALMLPPAGVVAPTSLIRYLTEHRVTVADLTPAYWHQLVAAAEAGDGQLGPLRLMITGGDQADAADCRAAARMAPGARLINAYGLTETTITSAVFEAAEDVPSLRPGAPVPVGKPLPHAQILVLDEELNALPAGSRRRDLHRRQRRRARLPGPARPDRRMVPAESIRRDPRGEDVPHRGSRPLAAGPEP